MSSIPRPVSAILVILSVTCGAHAHEAQGLAPNEVLVCEHAHFAGHCQRYALSPGQRLVPVSRLQVLENRISSVAVGEDVEAWAFDRPYFGGPSAVIDRTRPRLDRKAGGFLSWYYPEPWLVRHRLKGIASPGGPGFDDPKTGEWVWSGDTRVMWNDRFSSLVAYRRGEEPPGVTLRTTRAGHSPMGVGSANAGHPQPGDGFGTPMEIQFFPMPPDRDRLRAQYSVALQLAPRADLVRIPPEVEVVLSSDVAGNGATLKLPGQLAGHPGASFPSVKKTGWKGEWNPESGSYAAPYWYNLHDYGFGGSVRSLTVRVRGWTEAMEAPERDGGSAPVHRAPPADPATVPVYVVGEDREPHESPEPMPVVDGRLVEAAATVTLERDSNRPGHDYKNFAMTDPDPELCRRACADDPSCRAFTYVKPGIQGPQAHCWLKNQVGSAEPAGCCVSGVKQTGPE